MNTREIILDILLSIDRGEYSHIALKRALDKHSALSKQERSFITRICEGTLEHRIWIDYVLDSFSSVKVVKMKPVIRNILRGGVYELEFMDSVPVSATCNEAVKLAEKRGFRNLKGFVNGVLRTVSRNLDQIPLPDKKTDYEQWLSITYSMPLWIIEEWGKEYSLEQMEEILQVFLQEQKTSVRVNTLKVSKENLMELLEKEGVLVEENKERPNALFLSGYDSLNRLHSFAQGLFYVQDTSSMEVAIRAGIKPSDYIIDLCAAPGGKSIHAALLMREKPLDTAQIWNRRRGFVESRDLTDYKVGLIQENIDRLGLENVRAIQGDARILNEEDTQVADIVFADLPCSGLGVIGKKKDIKYKMTRSGQEDLAQLQREILQVAQAIVKPQGVLMYSTCTINKGENQDNTAWFLQKYPNFILEQEEQILPTLKGNDGFYIAKMRKKDG